LKKAFDLLTRAATAGYVPAQTDLGVTHALGLGTKADPAKAAFWYGKAADQGEVIARTNLARMKELGNGIPKDEKGAVELYEKALKDGRAQYYLGKMYQEGRGVKADPLLALMFIRKAADESNISQAQNDVGVFYQLGEGVARDYVIAMGYFLRSADNGGTLAYDNIGLMHYEGLGVPVDYQKALSNFMIAARKGIPKSIYGVGVMHMYGQGTLQNDDEAYFWFALANSQARKNMHSEFPLGTIMDDSAHNMRVQEEKMSKKRINGLKARAEKWSPSQ
ncbi:tetratricopeptide repeat protein, partial [Microvirga brassicacearum]